MQSNARMLVLGSPVRLLPIRPPAPHAPVQFVDPTKYPRLFKMYVEGTYLLPLIASGSMLAFDKTATFRQMTIVAVCLTPEAMGTFWQHQWIVKRLVEPFPPGTRLGTQAIARKLAPRMIVEQINPFRQYDFTPDQVLGVVACVGTTEFGPNDWRAASGQFALEGYRHD